MGLPDRSLISFLPGQPLLAVTSSSLWTRLSSSSSCWGPPLVQPTLPPDSAPAPTFGGHPGRGTWGTENSHSWGRADFSACLGWPRGMSGEGAVARQGVGGAGTASLLPRTRGTGRGDTWALPGAHGGGSGLFSPAMALLRSRGRNLNKKEPQGESCPPLPHHQCFRRHAVCRRLLSYKPSSVRRRVPWGEGVKWNILSAVYICNQKWG